MERLYRIEPIVGGGLHSDDAKMASIIDVLAKQRTGSYQSYPADIAALISINGDGTDLNRPNWWRRPLPESDGITIGKATIQRQGWLFAFDSLPMMSSWINNQPLRGVLEVGAAIRVVDVRTCIKGERQAIFRNQDVLNEFRIVRGDLYKMLQAHK